MTAKERLVEIIKDSDIYIPGVDETVAEELADAILKEFVRREDMKVCDCYELVDGLCGKCKDGIVVKGE